MFFHHRQNCIDLMSGCGCEREARAALGLTEFGPLPLDKREAVAAHWRKSVATSPSPSPSPSKQAAASRHVDPRSMARWLGLSEHASAERIAEHARALKDFFHDALAASGAKDSNEAVELIRAGMAAIARTHTSPSLTASGKGRLTMANTEPESDGAPYTGRDQCAACNISLNAGAQRYCETHRHDRNSDNAAGDAGLDVAKYCSGGGEKLSKDATVYCRQDAQKPSDGPPNDQKIRDRKPSAPSGKLKGWQVKAQALGITASSKAEFKAERAKTARLAGVSVDELKIFSSANSITEAERQLAALRAKK